MSYVQPVPLLSTESEKLQSIESGIESRLVLREKNDFEIGALLATLRDEKLYRGTHATFKDYCHDRWDMSRGYAYRLIESAAVVEMLPIGDKSEIQTESQARELAKIEPTKRSAVIQRVRANTGGKVTAAAIREAVKPTPPEPPATPQTPAEGPPVVTFVVTPEKYSLPKRRDAIHAFIQRQLEEAPASLREDVKRLFRDAVTVLCAESAQPATAEKWGDRKIIPPLAHWVTEFSSHIGYPMDGEKWCDGYEQKGWLVGKARMKDWQAACRNWKTNGWGLGAITLSRRKPDAPKEYKL